MASSLTAEIAIIGGSGLYEFPALVEVEECLPKTPYGQPSDSIKIGLLSGRSVAFLSRHGRGHTLTPTEVPSAANVYALKELGVQEILSISAVGSLREGLAPGDLVIPDQIIDHTRGIRQSTFFGGGAVGHVSLAEPYCTRLRGGLADAVERAGDAAHASGTYICIEGPRFSTRAESGLYRSWGADVIGMTAAPEAGLAREAELCYATLALVTDYDCWRDDAADVDARTVAEVMAANMAAARRIVLAFVESADPDADCSCHRALENAVMTDPAALGEAARLRLSAILAEPGHAVHR